jgi:hypothetical protein
MSVIRLSITGCTRFTDGMNDHECTTGTIGEVWPTFEDSTTRTRNPTLNDHVQQPTFDEYFAPTITIRDTNTCYVNSACEPLGDSYVKSR